MLQSKKIYSHSIYIGYDARLFGRQFSFYLSTKAILYWSKRWSIYIWHRIGYVLVKVQSIEQHNVWNDNLFYRYRSPVISQFVHAQDFGKVSSTNLKIFPSKSEKYCQNRRCFFSLKKISKVYAAKVLNPNIEIHLSCHQIQCHLMQSWLIQVSVTVRHK